VAGPKSSSEAIAAFGPVARSTVVDAVVERLQGEILSGRLAPGSRLPAEREFAVTLGINRLSLRAALGRLEALGLVATRHGAGTIVTAWRETAGVDALASLIGALEPDSVAYRELLVSFLELRRVLAAEAVALAAARHTEADLAEMRRLAKAQEKLLSDPIAFARGDVAFQRALIRAGRNLGFEFVLNAFARFPDEHPGLISDLYDRREDAVMLYEFVMSLVASGDSEGARKTLREGLERIDVEWLARHDSVVKNAAPSAP